MGKVATDDQVVEFIRSFCDEMGYSPSIREICKRFGYSSPSTIKLRLDRLRDEGVVTFVDRVPRTLRVVQADEVEG